MSVAGKLNAVMKAVGFVSKDGHVDKQNYDYLSEEAVTGALHNAFADAGLVIMPVDWEVFDTSDRQSSGGNAMFRVRVKAKFMLMDATGGEDNKIEIVTLGEGEDMGDKAFNKAMTAAYKYALRQCCMISTSDDPDHTGSVEGKAKPKPQAKAQGATGQAGSGEGDNYSYKCADCKAKVTGSTIKSGDYAGKWFGAAAKEEKAVAEFGRALCFKCVKKLRDNPPPMSDEEKAAALAAEKSGP